MRRLLQIHLITLFLILFGTVHHQNLHAQLSGCYDPANWTINTANTTGSLTLTGATNSMDFVADGDFLGVSGLTMPGGIPFTCHHPDGIVAACIEIPNSGNVSFNWSYFLNFELASAEPFGFCINSNNFTALTNPSGIGAQSGMAQIPVNAGDTLCIVLASYFAELSQATTALTNFSAPSCMLAFSTSVQASAPIQCNGGTADTLSVTVAGGTSPFTYLWDDASTTSEIYNVSAGTYCVTVTDSTGDTTSACLVVTEPDTISLSLSQIAQVSCNGLSDGEASVTSSGGTPPYTYEWDNGEMTAIATGLNAGMHTVTVSDIYNCNQVGNITITEPSIVTANTSVDNNVSCAGGDDGAATITAMGGTPPYSYDWDNSETTMGAVSLDAGTHSVTVSDVNGCNAAGTVSITEPTALTVSSAVDENVSCWGGNDGEATASVSGGTPPYMYAWSSGDMVITAPTLQAGPQSVTVTDANGCEDTSSLTITEPTQIMISTSSTPQTNNNMDGSATAAPSGGTPPYTYEWNTNPAQTTATAMGLDSGTYMITVTDDNQCEEIATITVGQLDAPTGIEDKYIIDGIELVPNPTTGILNIEFDSRMAQDGYIFIKSMLGRQVYESALKAFEGSNKVVVDMNGLSAGNYLVVVRTSTQNISKMVILD